MRFRRKPLDWKTDFARYERGRNLSRRTVDTYIWGIQTVTSWVGKPIWELTAPDLIAFMEARCFPVRTTAQIVTAARQGHRWAATMGLCELNGVMAVAAPKVPRQKRKPPVSLETARRLLQAATSPYEARVVYLGLYAGTRISESARMGGVNDGGDRLRFIGKGNVERDVPIHPALREQLPLIFSKRPPSVATLNVTFQRLRERTHALDAMGNPATSHRLRATCATTMYQAGVPWEVADTVLGHVLGMGDRYIEIDFDRLKDAVSSLDYFAGIPTQLHLF